MSKPRCPSCDSVTLSVERRPDGDAICALCGWHGKYALCFDSKKSMRKAKERITHAAVLTKKGWPILGRSHAECFRLANHTGIKMSQSALDQGFMTSNGRYVDRGEAYRLALKENQINRAPGGVLFSEMLWSRSDGGQFNYDSIKGYYL